MGRAAESRGLMEGAAEARASGGSERDAETRDGKRGSLNT